MFNIFKQLRIQKIQLELLRGDTYALQDQLVHMKQVCEKYKEISAEQNNEISQLHHQLRTMNEIVTPLIPFFDVTQRPDQISRVNANSIWDNTWGSRIDHEDFAQIDRQLEACKAYCTPLLIDYEHCLGHFRDCEDDYEATLVRCSCGDFQHRLLPCKHIYRLAYELDIFYLNEVQRVQTPGKILRLSHLRAKIHHLPSGCQKVIYAVAAAQYAIYPLVDVKYLIDDGLLVICPYKEYLLEGYRLQELINMVSPDSNIKKGIRKQDLISYIVMNRSDIIDEIERIIVVVQLSPYIQHLAHTILRDSDSQTAGTQRADTRIRPAISLKTFAEWDKSIHLEHTQIEKIARAKNIDRAKITYSRDMKSASIIGTTTPGTYNVTLRNCTCPSFINANPSRPCKHIYRLAMDSGQF